MAIVPEGQSTGQGLADLFGGVNRPQLNAFVATSQARNGLVSAQTQDAMIKATQAQEKIDAYNRIPGELKATSPDMSDSESQLARDLIVQQTGGDPVTALKAIGQLKLGYGNQQQQTSGQQMFEGKIAGPITTPPNSQMPVGSPLTGVPVTQSPEGAAATANQNAEARLHNVQADAGGFNPNTAGNRTLDPVMAAEAAEFIRQNPNLAGNFRSLLSNGGPDVIHAFLHPNAGAAPSAPANGISPAPGVSLNEQSAIRKDFASGTGAKQTTSLNTMVQHSQLFDAIADQMGNGNFTPTNYISQLWQRTFGSPVPSNLQIAGDFLGREAVRATINSGSGTGAERELQVNASSSPDAMHGAAATLRSLAAGQLHSLDLRAQRGGVDIAQLLGPEAQAVFGRRPVMVAPQQTPAPPGGPAPGASAAPNGLPAGLKLVN